MTLALGKFYMLGGTSYESFKLNDERSDNLHELFCGDVFVPLEAISIEAYFVQTTTMTATSSDLISLLWFKGWLAYRVLLTTGIVCLALFPPYLLQHPAHPDHVHLKRVEFE